MGQAVIYLLMAQKVKNLKQKIMRFQQLRHVQETFQKNFQQINGYVYDFSVDYDAVAVADILDVHKDLIKKNDIV